MANVPSKSKTMWFGVITVILGGALAYFQGEKDMAGAILLIITGLAQWGQRYYTIKTNV